MGLISLPYTPTTGLEWIIDWHVTMFLISYVFHGHMLRPNVSLPYLSSLLCATV